MAAPCSALHCHPCRNRLSFTKHRHNHTEQASGSANIDLPVYLMSALPLIAAKQRTFLEGRRANSGSRLTHKK